MEKAPTALKSIRQKCLDCSCFSAREVELCPVETCPLHIYRFGKSVNRKPREMSEERKEAARKRLQEYHAKRKAEVNA